MSGDAITLSTFLTILRCNFDVEARLRRSRQIEHGLARTHIGDAPELEDTVATTAIWPNPRSGKTMMPKIRFHKLAAIVVLIGFAAWMANRRVLVRRQRRRRRRSQGRRSGEAGDQAKAPDAAKPKAAEAEPKAPLRTVAVVTPPRQDLCARHPHFRTDRSRQARRAGDARRRRHRQAAGQAGRSRQDRRPRADAGRRGKDLGGRAMPSSWSCSVRPNSMRRCGWRRPAICPSCSSTPRART